MSEKSNWSKFRKQLMDFANTQQYEKLSALADAYAARWEELEANAEAVEWVENHKEAVQCFYAETKDHQPVWCISAYMKLGENILGEGPTWLSAVQAAMQTEKGTK